MAIFISDDIYNVIVLIRFYTVLLALFLPLIAIVSAIILSPLFCCCCCCCIKRCRCLHDAIVYIADYIVCFLKKKEDERGAYIVIYNYRAPVCYAYLLLFTFGLFMFHDFLAFWNATIEVLPLDVCLEHERLWNTTSVGNGDQYCIELNVLNGLEALLSVLGVSIIAMALTTWLLLFITKGSKSRKTCGICCTCRVSFVVILQIIGLIALKIAVIYCIAVVSNLASNSINGNLFGITSMHTIIAVCDTISLACLTPWSHFESLSQYNITPKAHKHSETELPHPPNTDNKVVLLHNIV